MRKAITLVAILAAFTSAHAQWALETSNTTADLRGIHSLGNGVAWASGTNGTVLRTEDGGYVWQSCTVPPGAEKLDFRGIQAFDANTAIVMSSGKGDLSRLYKTTDGCQSWKLLFTNPDKDGFWDTLQFVSTKTGVLAGDSVNGKLYARITRDGGMNWNPFENDEGLQVKSGSAGMFAASNSTLLLLKGGDLVFIAASADHAAFAFAGIFYGHCDTFQPPKPTWCPGYLWPLPEKLPIEAQADSSGVFGLAYRQEPHGSINVIIAVGGDYKRPDSSVNTSVFTLDSGETWQPPLTAPHGYRSAVAYEPSFKNWITVGPNGTDISTDDGKNWRALRPDAARHEAADADRNWNALSLPFVVGPHGRIGKLNDAALKH